MVEGLIRSGPVSAKHYYVAVGSAEAHQGKDAGRIECFLGARAFGSDGDLQTELADRLSENRCGARVKAHAAGDRCGTFGQFIPRFRVGGMRRLG